MNVLPFKRVENTGEYEIEIDDREVSERDRLAAIVRQLTDTGLELHRYAAQARASGDLVGCSRCLVMADKAFEGAREAQAAIAAL